MALMDVFIFLTGVVYACGGQPVHARIAAITVSLFAAQTSAGYFSHLSTHTDPPRHQMANDEMTDHHAVNNELSDHDNVKDEMTDHHAVNNEMPDYDNVNHEMTDHQIVKDAMTVLKGMQSNKVKKTTDTSLLYATTKCQAPTLSNVNFRKVLIKDLFVCGGCKCMNRTNTSIAKCSGKIANIPTGLPTYIQHLTILESNILVFKPTEALQYPNLYYLHLQKNSFLAEIKSQQVYNKESVLDELDLSYNKISKIEENSFRIFPRLTTLSLSSNKISNITKNTFTGLRYLRMLNLSFNLLNTLENTTFDEVQNLLMLDLRHNTMLGYSPKHFPETLLSNLLRLRVLYLEGNSKITDQYPSMALRPLKNLITLSVDGLDNSFDQNLKYLKKLNFIKIGLNPGVCYISEFSDDFFENTPFVNCIEISGCFIKHMNNKTFQGLKVVRSLSLTNMAHYDLYDALGDIVNLPKNSITSLKLSGLNNTTYLCRILEPLHAKHLQHMKLSVLDLSNNSIIMLRDGFAKLLPYTLQHLILTYNKLNPRVFLLKQLKSLPILDFIDVSFQGYADFDDADSSSSLKNSKKVDFYSKKINEEVNLSTMYCPVVEDLFYQTPNHSNNLDNDNILPRDLKSIYGLHYVRFGLYILFCQIKGKTALQNLDFAGSYMTHWGRGKLPPGIVSASFALNYCSNLTRNFFEDNKSLQLLFLGDNYLADVFAADTTGDIFSTLDKLEYLELASNAIYKLPFKSLNGLKSLNTIDISQNKLQVINISFASTKKLWFVDLSRNSISWITKSTLDDLDNLAANRTLYVDLTSNPLPCTCTGLPIIFWLAHTNVRLLSKDFLMCTDEDSNYINMGDAKKMLKTLQRHCASKEILFIICLFSTVCIALVILLLTTYRFRWRLRYLRTVAIGKLVGFETTLPNNLRYKYDAYMLYTDETRSFVLQDCVQELEVNRGHRLCIEERDFMPGTYTVSAIVSAVQNSAKTVPVVTPDFYEGEYTEYSLKMAVMEEIFSRRSVLHLCIYEPVSADDMSRDLLAVLRKNRFTEFPAEDEMTTEARLTFWNEMSRSISHNPEEVD